MEINFSYDPIIPVYFMTLTVIMGEWDEIYFIYSFDDYYEEEAQKNS